MPVWGMDAQSGEVDDQRLIQGVHALPAASNLMQISADNKLDTRSKLAEFLSANVFVV
jgi:hypothetical protein